MKIQNYLDKSERFDSTEADTQRQREYILKHVAEWLDNSIESFDSTEDQLTIALAKRYIEEHLEPRLFLDDDTEWKRDERGRFECVTVRGGISTDTFRLYFDAIQDYLAKMLTSQEKREQGFDEFRDSDAGYRAEMIPDSDYEDKVRTDENYIKTFDVTELQQIIDAVEDVRAGRSMLRAKLILRLMRDSGRRPREVCMVECGDLDFENDRIHYTILKKKRPTKEWVPVDTQLMEDLRTYLGKLDIDSGYVFFAGENDTHLSPDTVSKIFKVAAEAAGVDLKDRSLKNIRHTVITTLRREHGLSYDDISDGFTHNTIEVMRQSYSEREATTDVPTGEQILTSDSDETDHVVESEATDEVDELVRRLGI
jgi:integrase